MTHGMRNTTEYRIWSHIIQRCTNPKNPAWKYYGGRGITVCPRWRNSFEAFFADVGKRPPGMSIDRRDNDRGYEPGNVRWATAHEQALNRRKKTACPSGHPYDEKNARPYRNQRICRACDRERRQREREVQRS